MDEVHAIAQTIGVVVAALGGGTTLTMLARGIYRWRTGRYAAEKSANLNFAARASDAIAEADKEADWRRKLQDYAGLLRRMLVEQCGIELADLPAWPDEPTTGPIRTKPKRRASA